MGFKTFGLQFKFIHIKGNEYILADTISHLKSKNLNHKPLRDPKTLHCQDISLVAIKHPHAESTITTELIEEQKKMSSVDHWQQNSTSPDTIKVSILHT